MSQHHFQFSRQDQFGFFHLADHTPESPDSLSMHSFLPPSEIGMSACGQFTFVPAHGARVGETFEGMHPLGSTQSHQRLRQSDPYAPPWDPEAAARSGGPAARQSGGLPYSLNYESFVVFRDVAAPSEAGTVRSALRSLSDSGYGTMPIQSVGNPSVCGGDMDQSAETQSLIVPFQRDVNISSGEKPTKRDGRSQKSTSANSDTSALTCSFCQTVAKTPSELKKHLARHEKPHKCNVANCPRASDGFSTRNDLDRHKRCVHGELKGDEVVFRCDLGQCKEKMKDWPRQDNFRSHLKRKHNLGDVDLAPFTYRLSDPTDLAGPAEAVEPMNASPTSSLSWVGLDQGCAPPASLMNGSGCDQAFAQPASTMHIPGHTPLPGDGVVSGLTGTHMPQFPGPSLPGTVAARSLNPDAVLDTPLPRRVSPQDGKTICTEELPPAEQPSCAAPNVFSHTGTEFGPSATQPDTLIHSTEDIQLDVDDVPDDVEEDDQLEHQEVEPSVPSERAAVNAASEDGPYDTDAEDDTVETPLEDTAMSSPTYSTSTESTSVHDTITKPSSTEQESDASALKTVDVSEGSAILRSLMAQGMLDKVLMEIGYRKTPEPMIRDQPPQTDRSVAAEKTRVKCEMCEKTFLRRCELKKHQKRHARPYACTFAKCSKTFGSKNDWKRHETSQHCQLEIWRCDEDSADRPGEECGKACHRRESLRSHLEKDHGIREHEALEKKLADCRMGRNFESRFWCGFCRKIIEPAGKAGPAHGERFDHIDSHFNGRGVPKADIKDWKYVDADPLDPPDSPGRGRPGSGRSRKRLHGSDDSAEPVRSKRAKGSGSQREFFWTCCVCRDYWSKETTPECINANCGHARCQNCYVFENQRTQDKEQVDDGLMTSRQL